MISLPYFDLLLDKRSMDDPLFSSFVHVGYWDPLPKAPPAAGGSCDGDGTARQRGPRRSLRPSYQ